MKDPCEDILFEYSSSVVSVFMFKWRARLYAYLARKHGYFTCIGDYGAGGHTWNLGGRWPVYLDCTKEEHEKRLAELKERENE